MRSKRIWTICLAALCLTGAASAETAFTGSVIARETVSISADVGGTVESVALRAGDRVEVGETVATVSATAVYAPADGTVRGIFAQTGDSAAKTVMYIAPVSKYTVSADLTKAYSSAENKYVTLGQSVYLRCSADGTHRAVGRVTAVEGSSYTVEVTGGELYMEETVYIYQDDSYESSARIGSGTVSRTPEIAVTGEGLVAQMFVSDGESVERGQLLFTWVDANNAQSAARGGQIVSTAQGVVASVGAQAGQRLERGASVLTVYPTSGICVELEIEEADLGYISVGDAVLLNFEWDQSGEQSTVGTVSEISALGEQTDGGVVYAAYVEFDATDATRLGMTVTASVTQDNLAGGAQNEDGN